MRSFELLEEVSRMITEMGYDAPKMGEPLEIWTPKLHAFVAAMYEKHAAIAAIIKDGEKDLENNRKLFGEVSLKT